MSKFKAEAFTSSHWEKRTFVVRNHNVVSDNIVIETTDGEFIWLNLNYKNAVKLVLGLQTILEDK